MTVTHLLALLTILPPPSLPFPQSLFLPPIRFSSFELDTGGDATRPNVIEDPHVRHACASETLSSAYTYGMDYTDMVAEVDTTALIGSLWTADS